MATSERTMVIPITSYAQDTLKLKKDLPLSPDKESIAEIMGENYCVIGSLGLDKADFSTTNDNIKLVNDYLYTSQYANRGRGR